MKSLGELLSLVEKANKNQLWNMIYDFDMMGFYREDKRVKRGYIISCLNNCYESDSLRISEKLEMEKSVLNAMNYESEVIKR